MRLLKKEEVVFLNKNNVSRFGGNFVPPYNFLNESSLDYLVDIVDAELFGEAIYPQIYQKASITFSILFLTTFLLMETSVPA
ncbi:MAG: hypothetical protein ACRYGB_05040 [Janthinobacterium lividum]